MPGVDFSQARWQVISCLKRALRKHDAQNQKTRNLWSFVRHSLVRRHISTVLPLLACVLLLFMTTRRLRVQELGRGVSLTLVLIIIAAIVNLYVHYLAASAESKEIQQELEGVLRDYEHFARTCALYASDSNSTASSTSVLENESIAAISSGHPHISIVTVYRNGRWLRMPSLGLVEGDVIALMAGDITPGKVIELLPSTDSSSSRASGTRSSINVSPEDEPEPTSHNAPGGLDDSRFDATTASTPSSSTPIAAATATSAVAGNPNPLFRKVLPKGTEIRFRTGSDKTTRNLGLHHRHHNQPPSSQMPSSQPSSSQLSPSLDPHQSSLAATAEDLSVVGDVDISGIAASDTYAPAMTNTDDAHVRTPNMAGFSSSSMHADNPSQQSQPQTSSQPLYERHRALPSNSPELLVLSGIDCTRPPLPLSFQRFASDSTLSFHVSPLQVMCVVSKWSKRPWNHFARCCSQRKTTIITHLVEAKVTVACVGVVSVVRNRIIKAILIRSTCTTTRTINRILMS